MEKKNKKWERSPYVLIITSAKQPRKNPFARLLFHYYLDNSLSTRFVYFIYRPTCNDTHSTPLSTAKSHSFGSVFTWNIIAYCLNTHQIVTCWNAFFRWSIIIGVFVTQLKLSISWVCSFENIGIWYVRVWRFDQTLCFSEPEIKVDPKSFIYNL